jgi:hypothetical protein
MLAEANHTAQREDPALVVKPLVDLYMHQNTLMWSRVRLLSGIQASALVANYVLRSVAASLGLFILAVAATLYLNYIWAVDREIRNSYWKRLDDLSFKIGLTPEAANAGAKPVRFRTADRQARGDQPLRAGRCN